ncbi:hypothetical protein NIES4072_09710 [Nostoc commune NIES-4072]|uniref:Uncharacterized protein n=1 Tax=Nostoc commune NIES-4072 TaxID=2005467 RepID=A0A2R5FIT3_NOSCO|nr:hypothetical protein NIES4070_17120 [Nostoc commune HK-02]GBG17318.1 hypothetical protein NIES4072_09710 [Nostoc commune NIES-4072]
MNMKAQIELVIIGRIIKYAIAAIGVKKFAFFINLPYKYSVSILEEFDSG